MDIKILYWNLVFTGDNINFNDQITEDVYFASGGKEFKFPSTKMYSIFGLAHNCILHFMHKYKNNENMWNFKTYFIDESITKFDYEKRGVRIYSKKFLYKGKYVRI